MRSMPDHWRRKRLTLPKADVPYAVTGWHIAPSISCWNQKAGQKGRHWLRPLEWWAKAALAAFNSGVQYRRNINSRRVVGGMRFSKRASRFLNKLSGAVNVSPRLDRIEARLGRVEQALEEYSAQCSREAAVADRDQILNRVDYVNHNLYLHLKEAMRLRELYFRDLLLIFDRTGQFLPSEMAHLETEHPVALDSDDHRIPWGTAQDNLRLPRFVLACERHFDGRKPLTALDLGCAGGGLVLEFLLRGHRAYGIEGSNFSQSALRAEWRILPHNLFTGDITKSFALRDLQTEGAVACDVISAWEVIEHIAEGDLDHLFANIHRHLASDGIFIGSIALGPDDHPATGASYHRTVKPQEWWEKAFAMRDLPMRRSHQFEFADFARGTSNGPIDGNYRDQPELGFHFVASRSPADA